jgi:small-conductance mechanosensitive channel
LRIAQTVERMLQQLETLGPIYFSLALILGAILVGLLLHFVLASVLKHLHVLKAAARKGVKPHLEYFKRPLRALIPALCLMFVLSFLQLPESASVVVRHFLSIWIIAAVSWFLVKIVHISRDIVLSYYAMDEKDNLQARRVYTQIRMIERILTILILFIAVAAILMTFDKVRQVGVSLLASAGIMGIVLGFAAQRTLGNVIAGIQIAIAQPIRLDDVVVVENEWGRVEEITLTYVVVRIWDLRRLIVPISYFVEKPFQNWTRTSADLLGSVFIYADYTIPIGEIREELQRILAGTELWDKKVSALQVTDATKEVIEIRALMSASDSSTAWNLRCLVREKLIEFMQKRFPESLPRARVELENVAEKPDTA